MRFLALILLALPLTPTSFAQSADPMPAYAEHLGPQLADLLRDEDRRRDGLDLTLQIAASRPDRDLTAAVAPLLAIYRTDADVQHRRAAAVVLAHIGDAAGMGELAWLSHHEPDASLRQMTNRLLAAYVKALPAHEAAALNFAVGGAE